MKKIVIFGLVALLLLGVVAPAAIAQEAETPTYKGSDKGEAILFDIFFLRPLGFAGCAVGTAMSIIASPFRIGNKENKDMFVPLFVEPGRYTFVRPLGENYQP